MYQQIAYKDMKFFFTYLNSSALYSNIIGLFQLTYIQCNGAQHESLVKLWMKQIISAVIYMHSLAIAHRDLKLENILLFDDSVVKISDFGFCRMVESNQMSITFCGSRSYSAPEILLGKAYPPFKADVW
ncbi:hypothetical protein AB6A40_008353 [Gnathostoma spinigerum]|uniref:Protein kinase domain-containing protein n=1 Tax=Gnathostoma spinigerum TaxID=75299 RepID=A0ABD6ENU3_9BILA